MGLVYWYFAAEDDTAATTILRTEWPPPSPNFVDEATRPEDLVELEALLTDRVRPDIAADDRCGTQIAEYIAEDEDVAEMGLLTVTDQLTHALAAADGAELGGAATAMRQPEDSYSGLVSVARHAAANGYHLYCIWTF